jgi:hypothetical protein
VTLTQHPLVTQDELTCGACPVQIKGLLTDGRQFYFRYRHGWASVGVGRDQGEAVGDPGEVGQDHGHRSQGVFDSGAEMRAVFSALLERRIGGGS